MAKKRKPRTSTETEPDNPTPLQIHKRDVETDADARAHTALRPTVQAAITLMDYNKAFGEMSINTLVDDLAKQCMSASDGDLARAEALLVSQAHTLDSIFHKMARAATHAEYLNQMEVNLRLALKAQSQCRATLETLAVIRNPPVVYAKQANVTSGPQQINNGVPSRARENENEQNKLLEEKNASEWLDTGKAATTSRDDSEMEAVGAVDRTQK